jgi:hypothetical protein
MQPERNTHRHEIGMAVSLTWMMMPGMAPPLEHHPKFDQRHPADREATKWLKAQGRSLQEELNRIEWHGEPVYCTLAHTAMASQTIVDKLTLLLSKDNEEAVRQVR